MKRINKYLNIGILGMIATAILQITITLFAGDSSVQGACIFLYLGFITFLVAGFWKMRKKNINKVSAPIAPVDN